MAKGSRLSRGDARRNDRLQRLRAVVRPELAVLAIDLADDKQAVVVCDHDGRVLARRRWRCRAWELGQAIGWGAARAREAGFAGVVVACEPTGHRWKVVARLAEQAGAALVCVSPMLVCRGREEDDLTRDRSDDKDALVIARLAAQLRCYRPERQTPTWARLRHLGARRGQLLTAAGAARQQLRDLLECACPALLDAAAQPLDSLSWRAAVTVALDHWQGQPGGVGLDGATFTAKACGQLPRWGTTRPYRPIIAAVHTALRRRPGSPSSALARWNARGWSSMTGTRSWLRSARSSSAWLACSPSSVWPSWWPPSMGAALWAPPRSWLRPATRPASIAPGRWSSTPSCALATTPRAPAPARPGSQDVAGLGCGWPAGGRCGARCPTTRSSAPATTN
jgi:transposase